MIVLVRCVTPPQNESLVIYHLPPCRSEPVKALYVFRTQFKIFRMKTGRLVTFKLCYNGLVPYKLNKWKHLCVMTLSFIICIQCDSSGLTTLTPPHPPGYFKISLLHSPLPVCNFVVCVCVCVFQLLKPYHFVLRIRK